MVVTGMFLKRWQWGWHLVRCRLIWDGDGDWDARDDQGWCRSADSGRATAAWVPLSECISRRVSSGGPRHQGPAEPCAHPSILLATCYPGHLWSPGLPQLTSLLMSPLVPLPACHGPAFSLVSDHAMRLRLGHWHIFHQPPQTTSETLHSTFLPSIINKTWKKINLSSEKNLLLNLARSYIGGCNLHPHLWSDYLLCSQLSVIEPWKWLPCQIVFHEVSKFRIFYLI